MSVTTVIVTALVFLLGLAFGGSIIWFVLRRQKSTSAKEPPKPNELPQSPLVFHRSYITLPLSLALINLITAAAFYFFLPHELAFRFNSGGSPQNSMNRTVFIIFMLGVQFFIVLLAWLIATVIIKIGQKMSKNSQLPLNPTGFIALMSNMLLLPQVILAYLMLDAFIYGVWHTHALSFTAFALWAIGLGTILLIVVFGRLFKQLAGNAGK